MGELITSYLVSSLMGVLRLRGRFKMGGLQT